MGTGRSTDGVAPTLAVLKGVDGLWRVRGEWGGSGGLYGPVGAHGVVLTYPTFTPLQVRVYPIFVQKSVPQRTFGGTLGSMEEF